MIAMPHNPQRNPSAATPALPTDPLGTSTRRAAERPPRSPQARRSAPMRTLTSAAFREIALAEPLRADALAAAGRIEEDEPCAS